jgi:putative ABC transport system permease protein
MKRRGRFDRWIMRIHRLSRPTLLSLRNVFRQKGRLALTLITLGTGGAIFIGTFNVKTSLTAYINQVSKYFLADVNLSLDRPHRIDRINQELIGLPDVAYIEGWAQVRCELLLEDDTIGDSISLLGPPANSLLIQPIMMSGRWLRPGDENAIVLSERFLSRFPGIKPGDPLRLRVNGDETDWVVVGFFQLAGKSAGFLAYANYDYLSRLIHQPNMASTFRVVAKNKGLTLDQQLQLGREVETHLLADGYHISEIRAGLSLSASASEGLNVLTGVLLIMASLIALVGSIGLTGTMSLNVMERTREIGVMRAIGATDRALMTMVLTEGLVIGLMSWVISSILAFPISDLMSDTISRAIFDAPGKYTFTIIGFAIWLLVVLCLSIIASFIPARNAAQLTIREVLAYE